MIDAATLERLDPAERRRYTRGYEWGERQRVNERFPVAALVRLQDRLDSEPAWQPSSWSEVCSVADAEDMAGLYAGLPEPGRFWEGVVAGLVGQ